ncbi:MAG: hypothetical protein IH986_14450, partial [Planctomycetes bacterium]|nr:hypothetical protein [Planctomycetota bacterium]
PADPGQKPSSIQGGWGIGIPKNIDPALRGAAWRALTWITNKRMNRYLVEKYQIDANRTSAFSDPELIKEFPYLADSREGIATARRSPNSSQRVTMGQQPAVKRVPGAKQPARR